MWEGSVESLITVPPPMLFGEEIPTICLINMTVGVGGSLEPLKIVPFLYIKDKIFNYMIGSWM